MWRVYRAGGSGVSSRAAEQREPKSSGVKPLLHGWGEFAGDEGVQGAEASGEPGGVQAAFVVEPAEMTVRG